MTFHREGDRIEALSNGIVAGSVNVQEHESHVTATDLRLEPNAPSGIGAWLAYEVARIAGKREVYVRVALENEKAIKFYIAAGMEITDLVMRKK
jgi:ribosomal protein S18 acetylase RimI-like enzyme